MKPTKHFALIILTIISMVISLCSCGNEMISTPIAVNTAYENNDVKQADNAPQPAASSQPDFYEHEASIYAIGDENDERVGRGGEVNWVLYISARYHCSGPALDFSYFTTLPNAGSSGSFVTEWENAIKGNASSWSYSSGDYVTGYDEDRWGGIAYCLPDDPSFAGDYSVSLFFGSVSKTASFTLVYDGNYQTGSGWYLKNVTWLSPSGYTIDYSPSDNDPQPDTSSQPDFYELTADVNKFIDENDERVGRGGEVNWVLYINARYHYSGPALEFSYFTNLPDVYSANSYLSMWEEAINGQATSWSYESGDYISGEDRWGGFAYSLPDDPSFAGDYSARFTYGPFSKTVAFTLVYEGNYQTGTGWSVKDVIWE